MAQIGRSRVEPTIALMFIARLNEINRISASNMMEKKCEQNYQKRMEYTGKSNLKPVRSRVDIPQYALTTTVLPVIDSFRWYGQMNQSKRDAEYTEKNNVCRTFC